MSSCFRTCLHPLLARAARCTHCAGTRAHEGAFALRDGLLLAVLAFMWGTRSCHQLALQRCRPAWVVATRLAVGALLLRPFLLVRRESIPRCAGDLA